MGLVTLRDVFMKKIALFLFLFSLTFSLSTLKVNATDSFEVINGQSFSYDVITANVYAKIGTKKFNASTFQLGGHKCSVNDPVEVSVTGASGISVNFTTTCREASVNRTHIDDYLWYIVNINYYLTYVHSIAGRIYSDLSDYGNFTSMSLSGGLEIDTMLHFIAVNETNWAILENLASDLNNSLYYTGTHCALSSPAFYEETNGIAYFECWLNGAVSFASLIGTINNGFSCAYNMSNGVLLGLWTKGSFDGKIEGRSVFCSTELHIEQESYDLGELSLFSEISPVDNIVILFFGILAIIIVFRKIRNNN